MAKDKALWAAQLELLAGPVDGGDDFSHPYHWSAFQLSGSWR